MTLHPATIPIWLDWRSRIVAVVGLGPVGQRRALAFQRAGATVIGIDPMPRVAGQSWGELIRNGLELRSEPYVERTLDDLVHEGMRPDLVLACADRELNSVIVRNARSMGLWVVSSTQDDGADPDRSANAHLGAVGSGDFVQVAVHSGNSAPALSRTLKDEIVDSWLAAADRLAAEAARWRASLRDASGLSHESRQELLAAAGSRELLVLEREAPGAGVAALGLMISQAGLSGESLRDPGRPSPSDSSGVDIEP